MSPHFIELTDSKSFGKWIDIIVKHLHYYMNRKLESFIPKRRESRLLFTICNHPGIRQDELAEVHCLEKYEVTKIVKTLVAGGYVSKERDARDGRVYRLNPTREAYDMQRELKSRFDGFSEILTDGFSPEEKDELLGYLKRMANNIVAETHRLRKES